MWRVCTWILPNLIQISSLFKLSCPFLTFQTLRMPCWKGAQSWTWEPSSGWSNRTNAIPNITATPTHPERKASAKPSRDFWTQSLRQDSRLQSPSSPSYTKEQPQAGAAARGLPSHCFPEGKWLRHNGRHGQLRAAVSYKLSAMTISTQRNNLIPHSRHHGLIYSFKVITQG